MEFWGKVLPLLELWVTGARDFLIECDLSEASRTSLNWLEHVVKAGDNDFLLTLGCKKVHLEI